MSAPTRRAKRRGDLPRKRERWTFRGVRLFSIPRKPSEIDVLIPHVKQTGG
jgi:hypothetical protein